MLFQCSVRWLLTTFWICFENEIAVEGGKREEASRINAARSRPKWYSKKHEKKRGKRQRKNWITYSQNINKQSHLVEREIEISWVSVSKKNLAFHLHLKKDILFILWLSLIRLHSLTHRPTCLDGRNLIKFSAFFSFFSVILFLFLASTVWLTQLEFNLNIYEFRYLPEKIDISLTTQNSSNLMFVKEFLWIFFFCSLVDKF